MASVGRYTDDERRTARPVQEVHMYYDTPTYSYSAHSATMIHVSRLQPVSRLPRIFNGSLDKQCKYLDLHVVQHHLHPDKCTLQLQYSMYSHHCMVQRQYPETCRKILYNGPLSSYIVYYNMYSLCIMYIGSFLFWYLSTRPSAVLF